MTGTDRARRALAGAFFCALAVLCPLGSIQPAAAQSLDPASAAALSETLRVLANPAAQKRGRGR